MKAMSFGEYVEYQKNRTDLGSGKPSEQELREAVEIIFKDARPRKWELPYRYRELYWEYIKEYVNGK